MNFISSIRLIMILALLVGCAKVEQDGQSAELVPYIATLKLEYFEITGTHLDTDIPINLKDLSDQRGGTCHKKKGMANSTREIFINRKIFDEYKNVNDYITTIILHEIGHCIYGLEHDGETIKLGSYEAPGSIMFQSALRTVPLMAEYKEFYYKKFNDKIINQKGF